MFLHRARLHDFNEIDVQNISVLLAELIRVVAHGTGVVLHRERGRRDDQMLIGQAAQFLDFTRTRVSESLTRSTGSYVQVTLVDLLRRRM